MLGLRRDPALLLLGAGLAATLAGDVVYLDLAAKGVYVEGGPLDLTWLGAAALMALAATRRAAGEGPRAAAASSAPSRVGWRVLAVPMVCNLASLVLLAAGWGDRYPDVAAWCAIGCVMAGLVRTAMTFHEVRSFHEVRAQAVTDELTGLPNRRALLQRATDVLAAATAASPAALLLLDLDGFKEVNDSLGHHAGDELLRQVAPRLLSALEDDELAARLGGDEFAVLLPRADLATAVARGQHIRELLGGAFPLEGIRVHVGASVGVATAPVPAATVTDLLRCADVAMYAAKASREGVRAHVPDPGAGTDDRLHTMEELRDALATDQLLVHLQPQVSLDGEEVVGAEALVRWQHPTRGLLSPAALLPAAEQAGLLRPLAARVLELALTATATWWATERVPVSVNLSAADVTDLDLPAKVADALARHGLPPAALTLELVEDTLMSDPERGRTVLGQLRALGVRTSIDDYGTGYSSLAYLRRLPADELKLDRSLIAEVDSDPAAAAIVRHTVALAHDLGLSLVAEGIEDAGTARALARLGCDVAQGYAFARPMPVADFRRWLAGDRVRLLVPA
jgi:diguanylate cyclase (GGDEF)-like protein